ncbi:MAG TPA: glycoside hydrolase family 127 protein, partial [Cellvibrionaceae bacterium]|nr:glycoside hydrolase family 127 protein [Cellvibrionaceae bacterium]
LKPDPALQARIDALIQTIAAAQEPDGYIYTWRTIAERNQKNGTPPGTEGTGARMASSQRWVNEDQHSHELYNAGHLYEAAVAWYYATGSRKLLDVAIKNADLVDRTFGPGKLKKAPGHQEIEIGLAKLYQATNERRYLNLARFFLDARGYGEAYMQNHQPLRDQREAVGHAVRASYMFAGAADVMAFSSDTVFMPALRAVWDDIVSSKMYVTGGVGSTGSNEGFSDPYELPNYSAYCETCASIAFALWNQRMFQLTGSIKG